VPFAVHTYQNTIRIFSKISGGCISWTNGLPIRSILTQTLELVNFRTPATGVKYSLGTFFRVGNMETLGVIPRKLGLVVRDELKKFYKKYYSANLMSLCLVGKGFRFTAISL
jgi:hypothetical protein